MDRFFYIAFIDFVCKGKSLLEYTNLSFPSTLEKIDKKVLTYFQ